MEHGKGRNEEGMASNRRKQMSVFIRRFPGLKTFATGYSNEKTDVTVQVDSYFS